MKQAALLLTIFFVCCKAPQLNTAKNHPYEISRDAENGAKVLKGLLTRSDIENDTAFAWFKENYTLGTTNTFAIEIFKKNTDSFHIIIFGGTWCSDTQNLLPQFFRLADKAGLPEKRCNTCRC